MSRSFTILVDAREKKPLTIPRTLVMLNPAQTPCNNRGITCFVTPKILTLKTADYVCAEAPRAVGIERKHSIRELQANILTPHGRKLFVKALDRMADTFSHPYVILEGDPSRLYQATEEVPEPGQVIHGLFSLLQERSISLMLLPNMTQVQRRAIGFWVTHLLVAGALS